MFLDSPYFPSKKSVPLKLKLQKFVLLKEILPLKLKEFPPLKKILRLKKVRPRTGFPDPSSGIFLGILWLPPWLPGVTGPAGAASNKGSPIKG
jgi:hypothetical protein